MCPYRPVGGLHLAVVENTFAENQIAVGGPGDIVEGVVRVFGAEACEDEFFQIGLAVAVRIFEEDKVRLLGDVEAAVAEFE